MTWPIPSFPPAEKPEPVALRTWLPVLIAIASAGVAAVLLLWPHGKPTNTFQFWITLVGAPLLACALAFGPRLNRWESEQTGAEESDKEQQRLKQLWRDWSRRHLCVVDVAAFPAATSEIGKFGEATIGLKSNKDRTIEFSWARGLATADRRAWLLHLIAERFSEALMSRRQVVILLMLDDASLMQEKAWLKETETTFRQTFPGVTFDVEAQAVSRGAHWINQMVDTIETKTKLVIAAQIVAETTEADDDPGNEKSQFSEGAAAFLIDPEAGNTGSIFRPMTSERNALESDLEQIKQYQAPSVPLSQIWFTGGQDDETTAIRSALTADPKNSVVERLLDKFLGIPGPACGWIALAIAMEAMRGADAQLVAWREPGSEALHLCMISPIAKEEIAL